MKYFLVGEMATIDQSSNNPSITNIIEEFHSENAPGVIFDFSALACIEKEQGDNEEFSGSLDIKNEGDLIRSTPFSFSFSEKKRARLIFKIQGLAVPKFGIVDFILSLNGTNIGGQYSVEYTPPR